MKRIVLAFGVLIFVAAAAAGTTGAFFTDTKTTGDNRFKAGTLSIGVDQSMHGSLPVIVDNWAPGESATVEFNVINTGSLPVHIRMSTSGSWDFPAGNPGYFKVTSVDRMNTANEWNSLAISPTGITGKVYHSNDGTESSLIAVTPGQIVKFREKVLLDPAAGNEYQGKTFTAKIVVDAKQTTPGATWPASGTVTVSCPSDGSLRIVEDAGNYIVSWAASVSGVVEWTNNVASGPWTALSQSPRLLDGCNTVSEAVTGSAKFFRLKVTGTGGGAGGAPSFSFGSPVAAAQLEKGKTYTIMWTSSNVPATDKVAIHLKDLASATFINQFASIPNSGSVSWTVPSDIAIGSYALVMNNCIGGNTSTCVTVSGPTFVIKEAGVTGASIAVTAPATGATLTTGNSYTISWTANNIGINERVAVQAKNLASNTFVNLFASIPNSGSVSWAVPSDFQPGDYTIIVNNCVTGNTSACATAESGTVHVSAPSANPPVLGITSPTNGATVQQGSTHSIFWGSRNIASTERVAIQLRAEGSSTFISIGQGSSPNGSTTWVVPANLAPGVYKLSVNTCLSGNTTCIKGSEATITVSAAPASGGQPTLELVSPTANTSATKQSSLWVSWKTTNIPSSDKLALQFKDTASGNFISIFSSMTNSGGIMVPLSDIAPGTYQAVLNTCVTDNSSPCMTATGAPFTVVQ